MAYSNDRRLIRQVKKSATALGNAALWANSGRPIHMSDDFIFELYILFELILDLKLSYKVVYNPGMGSNQNQFPRKPANKAGRPKFEIYSKEENKLLWQICSGTKITDIVNKERTPDISIQRGNASDTPTHNDVEIIWDAKFRNKNTDRITHSEFSAFVHWIDLFKLKTSSKPTIRLISFKNMVANCLITNGRKSTEPDSECNRQGLKEVVNFFPGAQFSVRP